MAHTEISPLNNAEVQSIAASLQSLAGAQLQAALQSTSGLGLGFHLSGQTIWLWVDLQPQAPMLIRFFGALPKVAKANRPLLLFLRSRFFGRRLKSIRYEPARGRVLFFEFSGSSDENRDQAQDQTVTEIEIRLFPHGQNIIARSGASTVSEFKPKDIPLGPATIAGAVRSWETIELEWQKSRAAHPAQDSVRATETVRADKVDRDFQKQLEKKKKVVLRLQEEIKAKESTVERELGEWLNANRTLDVPESWLELIDKKKSLSCVFQRAKDGERKLARTRERYDAVLKDLDTFKIGGVGLVLKKQNESAKKPPQSLLKSASARGRRLQLAEDLEVFIGKSASDNLALLRKAQSFDFWLHLKDQPGSHAIIRRTRGRKVTDEEFHRAGIWAVEQSLNKRAAELRGERHEILIVECRFVKPIRGDRLGRVNYSNERVMTLRL
jgi:predicted ribosome quality control (RQC) complex YloA/Tae2 family protein